MKRYLILGDEQLAIQDLQASAGAGSVPAEWASPAAGGDLKTLVRGLKDEAEMKAISEALQRTNWNRKAASRLLKISYKALLYKIRGYGLDQKESAGER